MIMKMDGVIQQQKEASERNFQQRQEFINLQKESTKEAVECEGWKEYTVLFKEFQTLKKEQDPSNNQILRNLATRLWRLEKALKIDDTDTVTTGYYNRNNL
jgi:hypothetical protein